MKKITLLVLCLVAFAMTANAQFNFGMTAAAKLKAGAVMDTLDRGDLWWEWEANNSAWKANGYKFPTLTTNWNFNSDQENTFAAEGSTTGQLSTLRKASTTKGWWVGAYDAAGNFVKSGNAPSTSDAIGKLQSIGGGGDPVIFANIDSLRAYLTEATLAVNGKPGITPASYGAADSCAAVLLTVDGIGGPYGNRALAAYPGQFKKTDIRFGLNFASDTLKSDVGFTLIPLAPGNDAGEQTAYKIVISVVPRTATNSGYTNNYAPGANAGVDKTDSTQYTSTPVYTGNTATDGIRRYEISALTVSSTSTLADSVRYSVTAITGLPIDSLSGKKLVIAIIGTSTGTITAGKYAPFVGIDNVTVDLEPNKFNTTVIGSGGNYWSNVNPNPPTGIYDVAASATKAIGQKGQIEIIGAQAPVTVYNITGQKVAVVAQGNQTISVPAGVYLIAEKNQPTVKVLVK